MEMTDREVVAGVVKPSADGAHERCEVVPATFD